MKTEIDTKVRFCEINENAKLRLGTLVDYLQDVLNHEAAIIGNGMVDLRKRGRAWILSSWQIDIYDMPRFDEMLIARTWPYNFKGVCGKRNYNISRKDNPDKIIVAADSNWAYIDTETMALARITDQDVAMYDMEEKQDMEYIRGKIQKPEEDELEKKDTFTVRRFCLDSNNHMNNSWYIKLAEEYVADTDEIKRIRVEYKKSALCGEKVVSYVMADEKRILVDLRNEENDKYAVVEFTRK